MCPHLRIGVIDLLREAAIDPDVSSIKITAYRLAKQSRIVNALINAVRNGKQVTVILGSMFLSFGAGKIFILVFALIKIFFEVFIDFDLILKKAAKGELESSDRDLRS